MSHDGASIPEIVEALGVSKNAVSRARKRFVERGIDMLDVKAWDQVPDRIIFDAKMRRAEGKSLRKIGEELDVSHETVRKYLKRSDDRDNIR